MASILKFNEEALEELKKSFEIEELETINLLLEGKTKVNSIKKTHLETFRKIIDLLSKELNWSVSEIIKEEETISEVQNNDSESMRKDQKEKETCKFFRTGKCQHGRSGKKPDQQGKICSYIHPPVCKKHEKFGKCMDNRCKKLHLSLCRDYINTLNCKYGENCKFFHPTGLKDFRMENERNKPYLRQGNPTRLKDSRMEYERSKSYLRQENHMQHHFLDQNQGQNVQESFLELMKSQKEILRRLEQLEMQRNHTQNPQRTW